MFADAYRKPFDKNPFYEPLFLAVHGRQMPGDGLSNVYFHVVSKQGF
jgi:hypothetical protein